MIQISPHIETAQIDYTPQVDYAKLSAGQPYNSGLEETQEQPEAPEGFAEILAGLLNGGGEGEHTSDAVAGTEEAGQVIPLTEGLAAYKPETGPLAETAGTAHETAEKTEKNKNKPDELDFSAEEQNILLMAERLFNRPVETISSDEAAYLAEEMLPVTAEISAEISAEGAPEFFGAWAKSAEAAFELPEAAQLLDETGAALARTVSAGEQPPETKNAAEKGKNARFSETSPAVETAAAAAKAGNAGKPAEAAPQKNAAAETEGRSRIDESRSRDKRRGLAVDVRDFRTDQPGGASKADSAQLKAGLDTRPLHESSSREITLELHLPNKGQDAPVTESAANAAWETKAGRSLEDLLARELHQNFNNDIVRHASMALRDEGAGSIRLALKPETLGNVKIRLEMAENKITGHIVVESEEALRAFEREIHSLEQAFKDSGFEAANLQMSLSADGGKAEQQWQEMEASHFLSNGLAASRYDASLERAEPVIVDVYQRSAAVNVLA